MKSDEKEDFRRSEGLSQVIGGKICVMLTPVNRIYIILFVLLLFLALFNPHPYAADLNDLYKPLLEKDKFLYQLEAHYFNLEERGIHGGAAFDRFDANPHFIDIENSLIISPDDTWDVGLGYTETLHTSYKRFTYNPSYALSTTNEQDIEYLRGYNFSLRKRIEPFDILLRFSGNRQKAQWDSTPNLAATNMFTCIRSHYEELKANLRYLSGAAASAVKDNLSKLKYSLLNKQQLNLDAGLGYKQGSIKRNTEYYFAGSPNNYNIYHNLEFHLIPEFKARYGLLDNLQIEGGVAYTTDFKYKYDYRYFLPNQTSTFVYASYKLTENFSVPARLDFRPKENIGISLFSDFHTAKQRMDYWQKNTNNTITTFEPLEITYYGAQSAAALSYLFDAGKQIKEDEFFRLTKTLLLKGQWLAECKYLVDSTDLDRKQESSDLNIIDPYGVFLYPLDFFMSGSEYSLFLIGGASSPATNALAQNYSLITGNCAFGLTDNFNIGIGAGYRSESVFNHFTMFDLRKRYFKIKPYFFIDSQCDWHVTKNSMLSLNSHIVPEYYTLSERSADPKGYKAKNNYFDIFAVLRIYF
ncbi:MAG: hypothetical protein V2A72_06875 [Candidatus Omnitrophota bacterium]